MSEDRKKQPTRTSPRGEFQWPKLVVPDTKFKEDGEYSVKLRVSAEDLAAKKLIAAIEAEEAEALAEAKKKAKTPAEAKKWEVKNRPFVLVEDDEGNETGEVEFKFNANASGVSKKTGKPWKRKIALFDAKGKALVNPPNIGSGTVGKVGFVFQPYAPTAQVGVGVKLALESAQIIDLKVWGERDAASYGFGEEDGYEASDDAADGGFRDETEDTAEDQTDF